MSKIDLHIHSIYSDGSDSPNEIYNLVKEKGIHTFSITDHDTILGAKELTRIEDVEYIPGVELSVYSKTGRLHLLGYGIDLESQSLNRKMEILRQDNIENFLLNIELLKKYFLITFPQFEIDNLLKKTGDLGRPDIALLLIKYHYVKTVDEAFEKYLKFIYEKTRDSKKSIKIEEAIQIIRQADGIPSLAHAISLNLNNSDLRKKIKRLKEIGLMALEVQHIHHTKAYREYLYSLIEEFHLLESGGTDYHGPTVKPNVKLGTGINENVRIKQLSLVDYIHQRKD